VKIEMRRFSGCLFLFAVDVVTIREPVITDVFETSINIYFNEEPDYMIVEK
jgi:hypothetical protein